MKKMLTLLITLTLGYPTAFASDAPLRTGEDGAVAVLDVSPVLFIEPIRKGDLSPVDGRVLDSASYIAVAQRIKAAEAERDALKAAPQNAFPWVVVVLFGALALGGGFAMGWTLKSK